MPRIMARLPVPEQHALPLLVGLLSLLLTRSRLPAALVPLGSALAAAGVALNTWAVLERGDADVDRPTRLTTTGPYAHIQNPMYVGWSLIHLGAALAARSPWILAAWGPATVLVHHSVLAEEAALDEEFGAAHVAYAAAVPRYLPAPRRPRG